MSIIWVLLAQIAVIVPHLARIPWWIFVIWLLCALWRLAMFRGEASYPSVLIRSILVALGTIGVVISFGGLQGLDIAVALLLLSFSLKVVEVRQRRDLNLLFFLAFVVIATAFLFSQSIYLAAYQILSILFVLTAMVATQRSNQNRSPMQALRVTTRLLLQATPIMLVFFLVFPRLEPFWRVPERDNTGGTGMSETMSPGDIAKLNQSDELVFRASFPGDMPESRELYWRGMTLAHFDGKTWTRGNTGLDSSAALGDEMPVYLSGRPINYSVVMEPSQQYWLFPLPVAITDHTSQQLSRIDTLPDLSLRTREPLVRRTLVHYQSYPDTQKGLYESGQVLARATALPAGYNPRSIALAQKMARTAGTTSEFIAALASMIGEGNYYYTLEPPTLGYHSVDEFLFQTRKGFCEHYSSAAVVLLRAAGIPSRVVVGYQGGEYNALSKVLTVRQFDAHAWVEYWEAGSGWIRFDPTASVAPSRILMGMQGALQSDPTIETSVFSSLYYRNLPLIKDLRMRLEALNMGWQNWFVNFDNARQTHLLEKLLGEVTPLRTGLLVLGVLLFIFVATALLAVWRGNRTDLPLEQLYYRRFIAKLARLDIVRGGSEAPGDFGRRIAREHPQLRNDVMAISMQFEAVSYAGQDRSTDISRLKRLVSAFKPENLLKK